MKSVVKPLPWRKDDAERHVGGVWRVERRRQSWRRVMMRRRLDSARQGFQRLRARLFERRHAAGEKAPRDAFGHARDAERWISMRFGSRNYSISMQRRLNSTSMDPTIACTSCRAKAQAPMQPLEVSHFREEGHDVERIAVRSDVANGTMSA